MRAHRIDSDVVIKAIHEAVTQIREK